jgi:hypothetical protein
MRLIGLVLATVFAIGATLAHAAGLELIEVPSGAEGRTLTVRSKVRRGLLS